tara:strand:- start:382 stop:624 length:243 start_codon:yes stop_codon:yes gene_type:complete
MRYKSHNPIGGTWVKNKRYFGDELGYDYKGTVVDDHVWNDPSHDNYRESSWDGGCDYKGYKEGGCDYKGYKEGGCEWNWL